MTARMQDRFVARLERKAEEAGLEVTIDYQWANSATMRFYDDESLTAAAAVHFDWQDGYATIQASREGSRTEWGLKDRALDVDRGYMKPDEVEEVAVQIEALLAEAAPPQATAGACNHVHCEGAD